MTEGARDLTESLGQPRKLRVVIVDDHAAYREGLAGFLRANGLDVVSSAPSAEVAISSMDEAAPDVVILDLNLPGISGTEAMRQLRESGHTSRVLVLSIAADDAAVSEAIAAGASGYLPKDRPVDEILSLVRAVAAGESLISPQIARALLTRLDEGQGSGRDGSSRLGVDEREVLELFADGHMVDGVSHTLGISRSAVRNITESILLKAQSVD
jgi:DNA-binding NarL/FixJ family response regulator